ncbi:MAG: OmpH family outer membrane protein [Bryobacterales bacterium]|nr:OmpH family outer membrane protein [Bryobacterales bacterium]
MVRLNRALLTAVAALSVASGVASAQVKVGIINLQRAVAQTAEIKKAQAELEGRYRPRQEQMAKLQQDLQAIQQQLQSMQGKLTPQAESELTAQAQRKQREYQRMGEDLQGDVDRDRNEILQRTGQRFQQVVKKLAEEKGLDVVLDVSNTIFYKPALEITDEAVTAYDKAYPVK